MRPRALLALLALVVLAACAGHRQPSLATSACPAGAGFEAAAADNARGLDALAWSPFGAPETGWRVYAPAIGHEIGAQGCPPDSPGFAAALSRWQAARGLNSEGRVTPEAFEPLKALWQSRRPFLALRAQGLCPDPPPDERLAPLRPDEVFGDKTVEARRDALEALRRMRAAAEAAGVLSDPQMLRVFSGYRSPASDDARCAREQNCNGVTRAQCSAHRTGLALDLMVGAAPGFTADSSDAENRRLQVSGPAYRWLLANAGRFGFVNYAFEPWHWEWIAASP